MSIRRRISVALIAGFAAGLLASIVLALALAPPASAVDRKDCSDFNNQRQAQRWFHRHHPHRDPSGLDADHDGKACESLPCPCSHHRWKNGTVVRLTTPLRVTALRA